MVWLEGSESCLVDDEHWCSLLSGSEWVSVFTS